MPAAHVDDKSRGAAMLYLGRSFVRSLQWRTVGIAAKEDVLAVLEGGWDVRGGSLGLAKACPPFPRDLSAWS